MSERLTCEFCPAQFKTEAGQEWHVRAHMREAGFVVDLGRGWAGVAMSTMELPGEYLVVLRSISEDAPRSDEEAFEAFKRDMDSFKGVIEAIKVRQEGQ